MGPGLLPRFCPAATSSPPTAPQPSRLLPGSLTPKDGPPQLLYHLPGPVLAPPVIPGTVKTMSKSFGRLSFSVPCPPGTTSHLPLTFPKRSPVSGSQCRSPGLWGGQTLSPENSPPLAHQSVLLVIHSGQTPLPSTTFPSPFHPFPALC